MIHTDGDKYRVSSTPVVITLTKCNEDNGHTRTGHPASVSSCINIYIVSVS